MKVWSMKLGGGIRKALSVAALFLASKLEDEPRMLEFVIKSYHHYLHKSTCPLDVRSQAYSDMHSEIIAYESILLQTIGFQFDINPHSNDVSLRNKCQNGEKTNSVGNESKPSSLRSVIRKRSLTLDEYRKKRQNIGCQVENKENIADNKLRFPHQRS